MKLCDTVLSIGNAIEAAFTAVWGTSGVSEFAAALLGGGMTLLAQRWALNHDREKEEARRQDEQRIVALNIFHNLMHTFNLLDQIRNSIAGAQEKQAKNKQDLWISYGPSPYDYEPRRWSMQELSFLMEIKQFRMVTGYQQCLDNFANLVQMIARYRTSREYVLRKCARQGPNDTIVIWTADGDPEGLAVQIILIRSFATAIVHHLDKALPQVEGVLREYCTAISDIIGGTPDLKFPDWVEKSPTAKDENLHNANPAP